jgi:hypothetical protein
MRDVAQRAELVLEPPDVRGAHLRQDLQRNRSLVLAIVRLVNDTGTAAPEALTQLEAVGA